MEWKVPTPLQPGMTVAFIAPASASAEDVERLAAMAKAAGYHAIFGDSCFRRGEYGGTPQEQAKEFNTFMTDTNCDAVIAVRGGYGCARYLDRLAYAAIRKRAKIFVGYSDCTALLQALAQCSRLVGFHGPMGVDWLKDGRGADRADLWELLEGRKRRQAITVVDGYDGIPITGRLWGGNLTVLCSLSGTVYMPSPEDMKEGILVLEDIGEPPYKLDRMLQQLRLQGLLGTIKGILLGTFTNCVDEETGETYALERMVREYACAGRTDGSIPFIGRIPLGHGTPHKALPMGMEVTLTDSHIEWR